jgi:hypothetical protein
MYRLVLASLTVALAVSAASAQTRVHVIDGAVQLMEGHQTAPTIDAALALVGEAREAGDTSPATVFLHHRTYPITEPIVLDTALVGEGLEIVAAPSCSPTISGGRRITGLRAHDDGTWRTIIDEVAAGDWWFEELFVEGQPATRARFPNEGFVRVVTAAADNRTGFTFDPAEMPSELLDTRSEVVFIHDWSSTRVMIGSVEPEANSLTTTHPIGCKAPHYAITNFESHPRYFVEGSPMLVDAPGEWALDRETGELTYMPRPGETIDDARIIAPVAPALLRAVGTAEQPLRNLTVRGVRFAHTNWPKPRYGYAEGQSAFYEKRDTVGSDGTRDAVPAAIELTWAEDCTIDRCTIESVGGTGLWIGEGSRDCSITDSVVRECGANGIMLGEATGRSVDGKPWWRSAPEQVASGNEARHCLIERCGRRFFGSVGVWIGLAERTTVANCEIRDLPYTGVSVGWRWDETPTPCRDNIIDANNIHHVMQTLSDGGGIYTLGLQPGTVLRGNAIHDIRRNAGRAPSNGMFLDQGTTGIVIEQNTFWGIDTTPIRWHWTYKNTVRHNAFVLRDGQQIAYYNRATPEDIAYEQNVTLSEDAWAESDPDHEVMRAGPRKRP